MKDWKFRDYQEAFVLIGLCSIIVFHIVRLPFRSVQGVRVEFEKDYRCENVRGDAYWLHPQLAHDLLERKKNASFAPCKIDDGGWFRLSTCETHHLDNVPAPFEGFLGWIFNY
jgi:hypothetical protein